MIGVFDYTVLFTFLGTLLGCTSIYFSSIGNTDYAILFLILAGFFDAFDGMVARTKKNRTEFEKKFGIQLDSLSDTICFGFAPAFLAFQIAGDNWFLKVLSIIYLFTAISRLAWFNVDEEMRTKKESTVRKYYTGIPVTLSALIFPATYLLKGITGDIFPYIYFGILLLTAYLQLSKIQVPHLKLRGLITCVIIGTIIVSLLFITIL